MKVIDQSYYCRSLHLSVITPSSTLKHLFSSDLAPGNDEIYEEKQETFLTVGNPQDGQVVLYKVGSTHPQLMYVLKCLDCSFE